MKKNVKKLALILFLFAISLFLIDFIDVKGAAQGNGTNYSGGSFNGCGGSNCMWSQQVGIRFALVDENGNKVSGTDHIDAWIWEKLTKSIKNYDLYDDDNTLLWNFTGAFYGHQIKQEYFASPAGLTEGEYWSIGNIRHLENLIPKDYLLSVYDRWQSGWVHNVATYIINNTSDNDTSIMDGILIEMGYTEGSAAASAAGYYLQYEPIVLNGRVGSDIINYIFIGTPTEYKAYDKEKAKIESPYFSKGGATGIAIYRAGEGEAPNIFTTGSGNQENLLKRAADGKIYGEGVAHIWIRDLVKPTPSDCNSIVAMVNEWYSTDKIAQDEYDNYIAQVKNGTFVYKDEETDIEYKIEGPQNFEFLLKENYDKYNGGMAACANREKTSQDCEAAIKYINENYRRNTQAYHDAVDQVEAGTFTYEMYDGTTVTIDKAYSYDMLNKSTYMRRGGIAACVDMDDSCEVYYGSEIYIDDCTTGNSYFKDIQEKDAWLTCEIAYSVGNTLYSSDNTGHDAVENEHGGIVGNTEYCEVFCKESIETFFPTHVYDVKAGQTFTWGIAGETFGTVSIRKECSNQNYVKYQQGYRFEEWEEDYKNNEEAMIRHFMKNGAYESMISGIYISSSSSYNTCDWGCSTCTSKSGTTYSCRCRFRDCPKWRATARSSGTSESYSHEYIGGVTGSVSSQSYSVSGYESCSDAESAAKAGLKSKLQGLAADEEAKYSQRKNEEAELIDKIEQCTNNIEYVYDATIQFVFKEPVNSIYGANTRSFEFNDKLNVDGSYNQNNVDTSKCVKKTIYKYTCSGYASGVTCSPEAKQVWDCTVVTWDIHGSYTYKYPVEHFQWYSLKTNSTLVNENKKGTEDKAFFYSIGFGLPTALSLTDGTYELKAIVYNLGDNADFSGGNPKYERPTDTHFDPLGLNVATNEGNQKGFEYICTYEVDNEIFGYDCQYEDGELTANSPEYCDKEEDDNSRGSLIGLDIAYRLVTLLSDGDSTYKAFPGKDGNGRIPGGNWSLGETEIRDILDADVYNEPAMYEIMLDVNAIQKIRKDNQTYFDGGKDPYASYYDANNAQKVYCAEKGDEKYCASDFISNLYNGSGLNYRLLGTCLPTGNTLERAEYILDKGCDTHYTYPKVNWKR